MESLYQIFSTMEDHRDNRGKKHELIHIIILAIYGILCGYEDFVNMSYFLKKREDLLIKELNLRNGIPSHDTFSLVFRMIDPEKFMDLFIKWTKEITKDKKNKHIAIDGKAIKSAKDKVNNGNVPYIVSGFLTDIGISIGQVKVDDKSNEITAIPELLKLINIEDGTITIDAIGAQAEIACDIVNKKGHYCLEIKNNQKSLYADIKEYFDFALTDEDELKKMSSYETIEKGHGRIEKRKYYILQDIDFIYDKDKWKNLTSIGIVIQEREENNIKSIEQHYHILDRNIKAKEYAKITRAHWQIENNLHWILDVIFDEDHRTAKKDHAIENLALVRKIVFNLTKLDKKMNGKTTKKKIIDYLFDFEEFKRLIYEVIPHEI